MPFSPLDLFTGATAGGWWDAYDLSKQFQNTGRTTAAAVGSPVLGITDKGPYAKHQAATVGGPILRKDANNRYYWEFTSDKMRADVMGIATATVTILWIGSLPSGTSAWARLASIQSDSFTEDHNNTVSVAFQRDNTNQNIELWNNNASRGKVAFPAYGTTFCAGTIYNGPTNQNSVRVNATSALGSVNNIALDGDKFFIGSASGPDGTTNVDVREVVVLNRVITDAEWNQWRSYCYDKWGTPQPATYTASGWTDPNTLALTASNLTALNAVMGSPALAKVLAATNLTASNAVMGSPALTKALAATNLTAAPTLDSPALTQAHSLTATTLTASPALDSPLLTVIYPLTADPLLASLALGSPAITQLHSLTVNGFTANLALDTPAIGIRGWTPYVEAAATWTDVTPEAGNWTATPSPVTVWQ